MSDEFKGCVTCSKCGWVHFTVSNEYIAKWQQQWDEYWPTLDTDGRDMFGLPNGPPGPEDYYRCFRCGGSHKDMRPFRPKDCGEGHTMQPILDPNEDIPSRPLAK